MNGKLKLRKIGTSLGVIIPRAWIEGLVAGDEISVAVGESAKQENMAPKASFLKASVSPQNGSGEELSPLQRALAGNVKPPMEWCGKHRGWKTSCGCK